MYIYKKTYRPLKTRILILILLGLSFNSYGQDATIINQYPDNGMGGEYQLKQSSQYTFVVNYYSPVVSPEEQTADLVVSALNLYLDKSYQINESELTFTNESSMMMSEMSSIVNQGLDIFQITYPFQGFSDKVYSKLKILSDLNWSRVEYELLGDNSSQREEMLRYFVDAEFLDLKSLCRSEIIEFLKNKKVMEVPDAWANKLKANDAIEESTVYIAEQFIAPLEFTLNDPVSSTDFEPEYSMPENFINSYNKKAKKKNNKKKGKKDQFSQDVLALLTQNSDQLLSIQQDLVDFKKDNITRDRELKRESNQQVNLLQEQIDELKDLIYSDKRTPKALSVYEKNVSTEKVLILFDKNSSSLVSKNKLELNIVFDVLLKNPSLKIMITGFADKSGDPDYNAYISEKRAREVKSYLYKKGIANKRMMLNFLGDIASVSENSEDRRVEIEFLNDVGQMELSAN